MEDTAYPFDTMRDAFLRFMSEGMTYAEAMEHFDEKEFHAAAMAELDCGQARIQHWPEEMGCFTNDSRKLPGLFELATRAGYQQRESEAMNQAIELWAAGWTSELPRKPSSDDFWAQVQTMSLYWRRPARRKGKPGKFYPSTNQAWMALKRERANVADR